MASFRHLLELLRPSLWVALYFLNFSEGEIKIFGKQMKPDAYDIKAKIGVVFQDVAVFEELTVQENIDYFCGL